MKSVVNTLNQCGNVGFFDGGRLIIKGLLESGLLRDSGRKEGCSRILEPASPEALKTMRAMADMDPCTELQGIAKTFLHKSEWDHQDQVRHLWVSAVIDGEVVRAGFKVKRCTDKLWEEFRGYLVSQTIPVLYRLRHKGEFFGQFELRL